MNGQTVQLAAPYDTMQIPLFEGVCVLCNNAVDFVLTRDKQASYRVAPLQSDLGQQVLAQLGLPLDELGTVIFLDRGTAYIKSTAMLLVSRGLSGAWPLASVFLLVPSPLRDVTYDWIGRNRFRWFGRSDSCRLPREADRERYLDFPSAP